MARKEYMVVDIVDILRRCQRGDTIRCLARATGMGRNTVKKYLRLAYKKGFTPESPCDLERIAAEVLTELNASLPGPSPSRGQALLPHKEDIKGWIENEHLTLTKVHIKLTRLGIETTYSGLYRFVSSEIGLPSRTTVRMAETKPGEVAEIDFGRLGLVYDPESGKKRFVYALVVTLVFSRHQYVAVSLTQDLPVLVSGMEDAWQFFGGVTRRVIVDNLRAAVVKSDRYAPVFNRTFLEYSEYRGFIIDPAPAHMATGKPTVERQVPYVRKNFFQGETFRDLAHIREEAIRWCTETAGMRVHGTTRKRPLIVFTEEEKKKLLPLVKERFDTPAWATPTVHPDHHVRIGYSLYSAPTAYIGKKVDARKDSRLVRLYYKGQLHQDPPRRPAGKALDGLWRLPEGEDCLRHEELRVPRREGTRDRRILQDVHGAPPFRGLPLGTLKAGAEAPPAPREVRKGQGGECLQTGSLLRPHRRAQGGGDDHQGSRRDGRTVPGKGDRACPVRATGIVLCQEGG